MPSRQKHLIHDGKRTVLLTRWLGCCLRLVIAPGTADGMTRLCHSRLRRILRTLSGAGGRTGQAGRRWRCSASGTARSRPAPAALLELNTLRALDGTLAGASLRDVAEGLFGVDAVAADWYADSALRARVRRLVHRGDALMRGGYRRTAQLPPVAQGRAASPAKRP